MRGAGAGSGTDALWWGAMDEMLEAWPVSIEASIAPSVDLFHARDHEFKRRKDTKNVCESCGRGKGNLLHQGYPPSMNIQMQASGSKARYAYQNVKDAWQEQLYRLLRASELRPVEAVLVEGQMCFPDRRRRDQGNFRYMLEKALGDALVEGGYIADDDWQHYSFGNLRYAYMKSYAWTMITIHPVSSEEE